MSITSLLQAANAGDPEALERLAPIVYSELRWLAHAAMRGECAAHTLSTTALVHEAYLKLADGDSLPAQNRRHFFGAAARAMRQILIDAARSRGASKRGGDRIAVDLDPQQLAVDAISAELLALDHALTELSGLDPRLGKVVECRFFAGLTVEETAVALDISPRSVKRDWRTARAWLQRELNDQGVALKAAAELAPT